MAKYEAWKGKFNILLVFFGLAFSNGESKIKIFGMMPVDSKINDEGHQTIFTKKYFSMMENIDNQLRLFGAGITNKTVVSFAKKNTDFTARFSDPCQDDRVTKAFRVEPDSISNYSAIVTLNLPFINNDENYLICTRDDNKSMMWIYQDSYEWMKFKMHKKPTTILPTWLQILFIMCLLTMSGLFSGLNLGLMSLDMTELDIIARCGDEKEKKYAKRIHPVRKRGNYLLCTILLGNVLVNNTLTILLSDLTGSGVVAVLSSTAGIVVFGEIVPQAICSRHGLAIGAHTIWFTYFFMGVTAIASYPISKILDAVLGEEIGNFYSRDRLKELLNVTQKQIGMQYDEMKIIEGALALTQITIRDVMTPLDDVYMIDINRKLDFETLSEINQSGYSRIPVYEGDRTNISYFLYYKDLTMLDTEKNLTIRQVCEFYNRKAVYDFDDTKLDHILNRFKSGETHMVVVQSAINYADKDPDYVPIGIVTLEDVIEEILQTEIVDETDRYTDNREKKPRKRHLKDLSYFRQKPSANSLTISPQLAVAVYQYLSTAVESFKSEYISEGVLKQLIQKPSNCCRFKLGSETKYDAPSDNEAAGTEAKNLLYQRGKPGDFFILILQGKVEIVIGKEEMVFQGGSFHCFGLPALTDEVTDQSVSGKPNDSAAVGRATMQRLSQKEAHYKPDYTVRAVTDLEYLRIDREMYKNALQSTILERQVSKKSVSKDCGLNETVPEDKQSPGITSSLIELNKENKENSTLISKTGSLNDIRVEMSPLLKGEAEELNTTKTSSNI
ncbi:DgyrCDS2296 [Dimorphilus gyrociliatus]|uniref:DgyrCDS2296 n=1 Tax=Dimorphilus gyrociliatus TaxID=2664684 RepID=A0A7I8VB55_9ANNE|nr:DgyrCDS2296 [Dimorphilus gyrociliatus]